MNSACEWAFNTTEVLEHIVLQLPTVDILLSQRVCSRWREVIMASVTLRRLLFLSPVPKQISQASTSSNSTKPGSNGSGLSLMLAEIGGQSRHQRCLNLLVAKLFNINPMRFNRSNRGQIGSFVVVTYAYQSKEYHHMDQKDASWRQMFITQPPPKVIFVHFQFRRGTFLADHTEWIENDTGVRMGEIVDKAWEELRNCGYVSDGAGRPHFYFESGCML